MADPTNATLAEARSRFVTELVVKGPAPQEFSPVKCPAGAREITYQSGNLKLKAWVSEATGKEKKQPAVLFLHGGFAFSEEDWQSAKDFVNAGFVLMMPMLRGETGGSGEFEMFYGEVDDAIAAGKLLKTLPYVDSANCFVAGHSVGGTLAQLVTMMSKDFRAGASFSGAPDQKSFCLSWAEVVPFNGKKPEEIRLRSPNAFPGSIQYPLYLYCGKDETDFVRENFALAITAQSMGKPVKFTAVRGDHFSALKAEIANAIDFFQRCMPVSPEK